ncbi:hypothetical protein RDABS01_023589 [Bienertia sinuspersici]
MILDLDQDPNVICQGIPNLAARAGHAQVVELLVQADPNCSNQYEPNEEAETPLYLAAEKGCTSSVLTILQNPNVLQHLAYKGPCGRTALHAAVQWGDSEMVSKMLEKDRLLIRIKNDEGLTQLHSTAVDYLQQQPLKTLLDYDKWSHQRLINEKDVDGNTPLYVLAASIPDTLILHPRIDRLCAFAESYPTLNLKAFNKQNLTIGDILLSSDSLLRKELVRFSSFKAIIGNIS